MKMTMKRLFAVSVLAAAVNCLGYQYSTEVDGVTWYYDVDNGEATICSGPVLYSGDLTIPSSLAGYPVTGLGSYLFMNCNGMTSVTIPNGVTSIGDSVFSGCSGLTEITIPSGVTSIGDNAFSYCSGLTSITIPDSVTNIGNSAFNRCSGLTAITIGDGVTNIGDQAFYNCSGLTEITIPSSVTSIGSMAFYGCSGLTAITVPSSVTSFGDSVFSGCKIKDATLPGWRCGGVDVSSLTNLVISEGTTSIGGSAFFCSSLISVTIPDSVTSIGNLPFLDAGVLTSITVSTDNPAYKSANGLLLSKDGTQLIEGINGDVVIPDGVINIGESAFLDHSGLTSVTIPGSVTSIGDRAFSGCSGLTSVTIPDGTSIGRWAFLDCSDLTSVTIPNNVTVIGGDAFSGCDNLKTIYVFPGDGDRVEKLLCRAVDDINGLDFVEIGPQDPIGPVVPSDPDKGIVINRKYPNVLVPSRKAIDRGTLVKEFAVVKAQVVYGVLLDAAGIVKGTVEVKLGKPSKKGAKVSGSVTPIGGKKCAFKGTVNLELGEGAKAEAKPTLLAAQEMSFAVKDMGTMNLKFGNTSGGEFAFAGTLGKYAVTSAPVGGEYTKTAAFYLSDTFPGSIKGAVVKPDYLPNGEPVKMAGKKWNLAKAASVKYAKDKKTKELTWVVNGGKNDPKKTNLSALKLSYTAKTGAFKGSFKAYALNSSGKMKAQSVTVAGVVADGVGYGAATIKGVGSWSVLVE